MATTPPAPNSSENIQASTDAVTESQPIDIAAAIEGMKVHAVGSDNKVAFSQSIGSLPLAQSPQSTNFSPPGKLHLQYCYLTNLLQPIVPEKKAEYITREFVEKLEADAKGCAQNLSHLLGTLQAAMNAVFFFLFEIISTQALNNYLDHNALPPADAGVSALHR